MSEQYTDLITGRPLEPWAQEAMERRPRAATSGDPMPLTVALDFADNPRRHATLQAPADSMEELREALQVLAAAYREARPRAAVGEMEA